jgi:hypothetical protein
VAIRNDLAADFTFPTEIMRAPTVGEILGDLMGANGWIGVKQWIEKANDIAPTLTVGSNGIPSNADKDSRLSVEIAKGITNLLETNVGIKATGQTSGSQFETINMEFLKDTFLKLGNIRPGNWDIQRIGNRDRLAISRFEQYAHLYDLNEISKGNPELAAILGSDYTITPDVIISHVSIVSENVIVND